MPFDQGATVVPFKSKILDLGLHPNTPRGRLLQLADLLLGEGDYELVGPPKTFDIDAFVWRGYWEEVDRESSGFGLTWEMMREGECGTSACACGFAAIDPWFRSKGFKYNPQDRGTIIYRDEGGRYHHGFDDASCAFFDITHEQFTYLFMPGSYEGEVTAEMVADRIHEVVDNEFPA